MGADLNLPYDEIKFDEKYWIGRNSDIDYILEVDLNYRDETSEKIFPFCPEKKVSPQDKFSDCMENNKSKMYTLWKKLICD